MRGFISKSRNTPKSEMEEAVSGTHNNGQNSGRSRK